MYRAYEKGRADKRGDEVKMKDKRRSGRKPTCTCMIDDLIGKERYGEMKRRAEDRRRRRAEKGRRSVGMEKNGFQRTIASYAILHHSVPTI